MMARQLTWGQAWWDNPSGLGSGEAWGSKWAVSWSAHSSEEESLVWESWEEELVASWELAMVFEWEIVSDNEWVAQAGAVW
jgi:hypothetical protein